MQNFHTKISSPIGDIVLTSKGEALTGLYTCEHSYFAKAQEATYNPTVFLEAIKQLDEYFNKRRTEFNLAIAPAGSEFQQLVWKSLHNIPYGSTMSYGEIAKLLKTPNASRAVGMANSKNPICIIVPCHRVIGANGQLSGYAGGIKTKEWLLAHESRDKNNYSDMQVLIPGLGL